jgi:hypothetical protein
MKRESDVTQTPGATGIERVIAVGPAADHRHAPAPIATFLADEIAEMHARDGVAAPDRPRCDACDEIIEGEAAGSGLYMWTRGDEVRFEEPALCPNCATAIGVTAIAGWTAEEEEG